jgi:PrtD family type I secretion system ABC transporter
MDPTTPQPTRPNPLNAALKHCVGGFAAVVALSLALNLLMLTAPLYMLQVFDRVISGHSTSTLIYLTLIAGLAFMAFWGLDMIRRSTMVALGGWLERRVGGDALGASLAMALGRRDATVQGVRDLGTVRSFLTGPSVIPMLDAPWTPLFLVILFLLHPLIGVFGTAGAVVLFAFALANEFMTRTPTMRAAQVQARALDEAHAATRNADVIHAMGMSPNLVARWNTTMSAALGEQSRAGNLSGIISSTSKFIRQALQVGIMAVGAWLVLGNELSPGGMIAGSILMARALAPVEQSIEAWRTAIMARAAYRRVTRLLDIAAPPAEAAPLPAPTGALSVEGVSYAHPGEKDPMLRNIAFKLAAGESLGLIGPTAVGKTTLARLLVGNLAPKLGHVRLDGVDIARWDPRDRGKYVGYLPQDVELFSGSVRDNISRLGEADPEAVYAAAGIAGVHEDILKLPNAYDTEIGVAGLALSGGQRQKIALARAVFGGPKLIVLDEPNSNLDMIGESALIGTLQHLKSLGTTVVIIAHRPGVLRTVDKILVLNNGTVEMMGPRDEVFARVAGPVAAPRKDEQPAGPQPAIKAGS